ncbi:MAG: site-specific DNA-methyltransferase [Alcanivorax sp.]|nr:site-specific DNA-methyltransferase [Alcanivorax sp.]MBF48784.1 site-specific DNA-methyltransferase [Alcanivorax sp.]MBT75754.1 site-specific DNA-methyltransferase [Alcanivorax sp.]HAD46876.1 site-specific DNA-methyltransferase [Alcanivorax sp.]|tara:strand:- start:6769 stop:8826 length:2058 start_codon:yes stop_codon:yes gene_type:complete
MAAEEPTLDKLKMYSPDLSQDNIAKIRELFPGCVTEARDEATGKLRLAVDFDQLRQELSGQIVEGTQERYRLDWPGKREALTLANAPIGKTFRPVRAESLKFDTAENILIEGDNLAALKIMQESYLGKVDLIYIDPPYNSSGDLIYDDDFSEAAAEYFQKSLQNDGDGQRLVANLEAEGRFHSKWLTMMYSRLKVARNLLSDSGAILVQIDERESANLMKLMEEVFGSANLINIITIKTKMAGVSGSHLGGTLPNNTEQIIFFAKNKENFSIRKLPTKRQELISYINTMKASGKSWKYTQVLVDAGTPEPISSFEDGSGQLVSVYKHDSCKLKTIARVAEEEFDGDEAKAYYAYFERIFRTTNAQTSIRQKVIDATSGIDSEIFSIKYKPQKGRNAGQEVQLFYRGRSRELFAWLKDIVEKEGEEILRKESKGNLWDDIQFNNIIKEGGVPFSNGKKPIELIQDIIEMVCPNNALVLDFFAGSCSTGHAVWASNARVNSYRRFILCQLDETIRDDDLASQFGTVSRLGAERLRRAHHSLFGENSPNGSVGRSGFRFLKIDTSNMKDVYYSPDELKQSDLLDMVDNVKEDRAAEDLLFQVLVDWGVDLTLPIRRETVQDKTVFFVDDNALVACFHKGITEELVKELAGYEPLRVVLRDNGFVSDAVKINVEQVFRQLSPTTEVKSI